MIKELKYIEDEIEILEDLFWFYKVEDRVSRESLYIEIEDLHEAKISLLSLNLDMAHKELKATKRMRTVSLNRPETGDTDIPF